MVIAQHFRNIHIPQGQPVGGHGGVVAVGGIGKARAGLGTGAKGPGAVRGAGHGYVLLLAGIGIGIQDLPVGIGKDHVLLIGPEAEGGVKLPFDQALVAGAQDQKIPPRRNGGPFRQLVFHGLGKVIADAVAG